MRQQAWSFLKPSGAETEMIQDNLVNTTAADTLPPCGARPAAATIMTMQEKYVLAFYEEEFQPSIPTQYWEVKEKVNVFCVFRNTVQGLTHWGRVTHICVANLTTIASDNGLSPGRRQAIIWTNAGILLIRPLWTNFSEILIKISTFSFKKMRLKVSSAKWRPFCLGLNVLKQTTIPQGLMLWPVLWKLAWLKVSCDILLSQSRHVRINIIQRDLLDFWSPDKSWCLTLTGIQGDIQGGLYFLCDLRYLYVNMNDD